MLTLQLKNVHYEGEKLTRLYAGPPSCVYFVGEYSATAIPPWNWGVPDEQQPPVTPPRPVTRAVLTRLSSGVRGGGGSVTSARVAAGAATYADVTDNPPLMFTLGSR